jgi:hypothetical protein
MFKVSALYTSPALMYAGKDGIEPNQLQKDIEGFLNDLNAPNRAMANNLLCEKLIEIPVDRLNVSGKNELLELLRLLDSRIYYDQPDKYKNAQIAIQTKIKELERPNVEDIPGRPRSLPFVAPSATLEMDPTMGGRPRKVSCGCRARSRSRSKSRGKSRGKSRRGRPRSKLRR